MEVTKSVKRQYIQCRIVYNRLVVGSDGSGGVMCSL